MLITPIKTRTMVPPQDDLLAVIRESISSLEEKSIVVITSKVVSIWEGRCILKTDVPDKDALIIQESERYLPRDLSPKGLVMHTINHNLLIPSAGIDESNAHEHYILWPENPQQSAKKLYDWVRQTYSLHDVGIIITDSHTIPLRHGTLGISLAHFGMLPMHDYRGTPDLFGRNLKMTLTDIVDGLAAAAVVTMGEGDEATPLAIITDFPKAVFVETPPITAPEDSFQIDPEIDIYYPILSAAPWKDGGKGNHET